MVAQTIDLGSVLVAPPTHASANPLVLLPQLGKLGAQLLHMRLPQRGRFLPLVPLPLHRLVVGGEVDGLVVVQVSGARSLLRLTHFDLPPR